MVTLASVVLWASLGADAGCTPLHQAALDDDVPQIRKLLAGRVLGLLSSTGESDLDQMGHDGACAWRTPLMAAAEAGNAAAVKELLARGADASVVLDDPTVGKVSAWCLALMSNRGKRAMTELSPKVHPLLADAVCADNAMLIWAAREGTAEDLRFQLEGSPGQKALEVALKATVGRRELDELRPELIGRINRRAFLQATLVALDTEDTLTLDQLAAAGVGLDSQELIQKVLHGALTDRATTRLLGPALQMTRLSSGELSELVWHELSQDHLDALGVIASGCRESNVALGQPFGPNDEGFEMAMESSNPKVAVSELIRLESGVSASRSTPYASDRVSRAAGKGDCAVIEVLAAAGAELNQVDHRCQTPADVARANGYYELSKALAEATRGHKRLANPWAICPDTVEVDPVPRRGFRCPDSH